MRPVSSGLTVERLRGLMDYDPDTGVFTWRVRPSRSNIAVGDVAGYLDNGRNTIKVDGRRYQASRLAWLYMTGEWPISLVDHKDLNKRNDAWENLRPANWSQNGCNRPVSKNNSSGYKGAFPLRGRFLAQIRIRGKQIYLGMFDTAELAHQAYIAAAQRLHGEFARAA